MPKLKRGSELKPGDRFQVTVDAIYVIKEDGDFYNEVEGWRVGKIRQDALCIVLDEEAADEVPAE
jgi:hypothetical protein